MEKVRLSILSYVVLADLNDYLRASLACVTVYPNLIDNTTAILNYIIVLTDQANQPELSRIARP